MHALIIVVVANIAFAAGMVLSALLQRAVRAAADERQAARRPLMDNAAAYRWIMGILRAEYAYWRDSDDTEELGAIEDAARDGVTIGAMGAVANVMAAVCGQPAPWHLPQPPAATETTATAKTSPAGPKIAEAPREPEEREIA